MNLISILLATAFLFLLVRACLETAWGLMQLITGLSLIAISWMLQGLAWSLRACSSLWKTAFP